jgi:hypothetical protein
MVLMASQQPSALVRAVEALKPVLSQSLTAHGSVRVLGFGSLLSETSARHTFPKLHDFHLVQVHDYRRVFTHPASIFFERGIATLQTKEISSLSTEKNEGSRFTASVFEIDDFSIAEFIKREEEFDFVSAPFVGLGEGSSETGHVSAAYPCLLNTMPCGRICKQVALYSQLITTCNFCAYIITGSHVHSIY